MNMNTPTAKEPESNISRPGQLEKVPTGIQGLDEITCGGLPRGRATLVYGGPGCGKTLLALEFLVHGATRYGEPGVFVAFEETAGELATNAAALGFDLAALEADRKLAIDQVRIERSEIEESGECDLEGLFIRLGFAIDSIGAKRVAIDTLEMLFDGLPNLGILRAELRRKSPESGTLCRGFPYQARRGTRPVPRMPPVLGCVARTSTVPPRLAPLLEVVSPGFETLLPSTPGGGTWRRRRNPDEKRHPDDPSLRWGNRVQRRPRNHSRPPRRLTRKRGGKSGFPSSGSGLPPVGWRRSGSSSAPCRPTAGSRLCSSPTSTRPTGA
jgi:hypothetical protein